MELQIQELVSSIRKEGIDAANAEAETIIAEAGKKAEAIIAAARSEAKETKETAEREIGILKERAAESAGQAKRDAVLSFRAEVEAIFERLLAADVAKALDGKALGTLIRAALAGEDVSAYAAEVAAVSDELRAELATELKNGLEIRPTRSVKAGFRLAAKDGSGYFDCSEEEIMQMLMPYFRNLGF